MNDEEAFSNYAAKVGERLRLVRKQKHLSLQAVEAASQNEFKASVLGAYERGERTISVPRLQRLAQIYNVPVDQLLPRDLNGAMSAMGAGTDAMVEEGLASRQTASDGESTGRITIDLTRLDDVSTPERDLLRRYLGMIQVQRQDFNGRVLTIRSDDVRAIGCLFDTTAAGIRNHLESLGLRHPARG